MTPDKDDLITIDRARFERIEAIMQRLTLLEGKLTTRPNVKRLPDEENLKLNELPPKRIKETRQKVDMDRLLQDPEFNDLLKRKFKGFQPVLGPNGPNIDDAKG